MQVLQAGSHKLFSLELDPEFVINIVKEAGFEYRVVDAQRQITVELMATDRQAPLLLFDAADPGNLGWFSRCQFYVDGRTGAVLQTPITVANQRDRSGHVIPNALRVQIAKEIPASFHMPGKLAITEQAVYALLHNFLEALISVGVGVCGGTVVRPLAGRTESFGTRN
jgi:hypothetical protein